MSPDQIDALSPVLEEASPVEKLFFAELRHTRQEMEKLFAETNKNCISQKGLCTTRLREFSTRISELEVQNRVDDAVDKAVGDTTRKQLEDIALKAVNKRLDQYSFQKIAVGSAAGGGTIAALIQWLSDFFTK